MTGQEALRTTSAQGFGQPGMAEPRRAFSASRPRNTARLYSARPSGAQGSGAGALPERNASTSCGSHRPPARLHTVECPVADVVGIGQDRHMRRRQPVPAGQRPGGRVTDLQQPAGHMMLQPFPDIPLGGAAAPASSAEVAGPPVSSARYRPSRSPRYRRSPEPSLWAATMTRIPYREPSISDPARQAAVSQ